MKVLHLSYSDLGGGAARAAYRNHQALQSIGINSQMLVINKLSTAPTVIGPTEQAQEMLANTARLIIDRLPLRHYPQKTTHVFSPAIFPARELKRIQALNPDVINLHWINKGFLRPESLPKLGKPLVWTMHDIWAVTGGCHYPEGCDRYTSQCGRCPQLGSNQSQDLSRKLWRRKAKAWGNHLNLHIVGVSRWIADCVQRSSLLGNYPVDVIGETLNPEVFCPRPQALARQLLNLNPERRYILFGALNPTRDRRKGFQHLQPALQKLRGLPNTEVLLLGTAHYSSTIDLGFPITCLGKLSDDLALSLAYSAADVVIVPSEEDACPLVSLEALACGVPVVSFDCTGLKDIVRHQINGYRARPFDSDDLAHGIQWILDLDHDQTQQLKTAARQTIETTFAPQHQAAAYKKIYANLLRR
ncbi:MAG: glycosyltransferase [Spirulina sp. SIO3F2]|nr:glycosyltransferase [Spirulina sp. SIO3F2]